MLQREKWRGSGEWVGPGRRARTAIGDLAPEESLSAERENDPAETYAPVKDPSRFIRPRATHSWLQRWSRWRRRVARDFPIAIVSRAPTKAHTTAPPIRRPSTRLQSWVYPLGRPPGTFPVVSIPRHLTYSGHGLRVVARSPTHISCPSAVALPGCGGGATRALGGAVAGGRSEGKTSPRPSGQ